MSLLYVVGLLFCMISKAVSDASGDEGLHEHRLTLTSVMLQHVLTWQAPEDPKLMNSRILYTVKYRYREIDEYHEHEYHYEYDYGSDMSDMEPSWDDLPTCINITATRCDMYKGPIAADIPNDYLFRVEGRLPGSSEVIYLTETIYFNLYDNMTLIPPNITTKLHGDMLFLKPDMQYHWNGTPIKQHNVLEGIVYQIEYWRKNDPDDVQVKTEPLDSEIPVQIGYCARLRLYIEKPRHLEPGSIFSEWTDPPVCAEPGQMTGRSTSDIVKYISAGVGALVAILILSYFVYKIRKVHKVITKKAAPPDVLMSIFQDTSEPFKNAQEQEAVHFVAQEVVDNFPSSPIRERSNNDPPIKDITESTPIMEPILYAEDDDHVFGEYLLFEDAQHACEVDAARLATASNVHLTVPNPTGMVWSSGDADSCWLKRMPLCDGIDERMERLALSDYSESELGQLNDGTRLNVTRPRRAPSVSISSAGSGSGLIFDIQRSKDFAASNFYLSRGQQRDGHFEQAEKFNIAYSSNPKRDIPDILFCDYVNEPESGI